MTPMIALAVKDLRLLFRNKAALFFTVFWPLIVSVFFGLMLGGDSVSTPPPVAVVDLDQTPRSRAFVADIRTIKELEIDEQNAADAERLVRAGRRAAAVVLPQGYGERAKVAFGPDPPKVELWVDPSRKAERAMLEGLLMKAGGLQMQRNITDSSARKEWLDAARKQADTMGGGSQPAFRDFYSALDRFLETPEVKGTTDANGEGGGGGARFTPLAVETRDVAATRLGPTNAYAISFTQGMFWGLLGCLMTFVSSLVLERVEGTWGRLRATPLSPGRLLLGKAIACAAVMFSILILLGIIGRVGFGLRPRWALLLAAFACSSVCFTGLMMLLASLGRTVQAATGVAWAVMMPLAMFGGGMMPLFVLPRWVQTVSNVSPVKWAVLSFEGAIWRGFDVAQMAVPCAILIACGVVAGILGAGSITRRAV